jgi:hypothetical protein
LKEQPIFDILFIDDTNVYLSIDKEYSIINSNEVDTHIEKIKNNMLKVDTDTKIKFIDKINKDCKLSYDKDNILNYDNYINESNS